MIDVLKPLIKQFLPFAQEKMGFERPPRLFLKQDAENAANPLGKTGFYDPQAESITLFITGRHPKDVMRSLSHELMHHTQKCNGEFENVENMGEQGYAQNNPHMRTMEIHAYQASIVFRDWEDSIKGTIYNESLQKGATENMTTKNWKNGELNTLLTEKWGFKMNLDALNERRTGSGRGHGPGDTSSSKKTAEEYIAGSKKARSRRSVEGEEEAEEGDDMTERISEEGDTAEHCTTKTEWKHGPKREWDDSGKAAFEECMSKPPEGPAIREVQIFKGATEICMQRHDLLGDKAVRGCIEEEMTRLMNEGCPYEEEEEEEEVELYEKHDADWGMGKDEESRTRPGEKDYTGHKGDESKTHSGEDYEDDMGSEEDPADLAAELLGLAHRMGNAVGVSSDVSTVDDEMDVEVEEEELDERHKPPNVTQGREPGRRKKNINTGQKTIDEERIREIAKAAIKHFRANGKR